ncbi:unnamed protein product [Vitrella brassicaformis CCMP3155]|uniref:Protein kinase domain-containing protein n=1 Tax=Vitrella brassicaformis (strain CCMP3155) TaxID=1169540 RepID=A0A0G4H5F3_VITBC|nr:unnamed protein product [Vitrella brassicaformis CCMP3155]|eukprot:CEM39021.1 unnamed protein product [Vitrella brassicaformis CCMP3155]
MTGVPFAEVLAMMEHFVNESAKVVNLVIDPATTVSVKGHVSLLGGEGADLSSVKMPFGRFLVLLLLEGVYRLHRHGLYHGDLNAGNILLPLHPTEAIDPNFGFQIPGEEGVMLSTEISAKDLQLIDFSTMRIIPLTESAPFEWDDIAHISSGSISGLLKTMLARDPGDQKALDMLSALLDPSEACFVHSTRYTSGRQLIKMFEDPRLHADTETDARRSRYMEGVGHRIMIYNALSDHVEWSTQHSIPMPSEARKLVPDVPEKYHYMVDWMAYSCSPAGEENLLRKMAILVLGGQAPPPAVTAEPYRALKRRRDTEEGEEGGKKGRK